MPHGFQPFFIVGLGRSGSTMLYRRLSRHPRVALTNEARVADFLVFASEYAAVPRGEELAFPFVRDYELHGILAPWEVDHFDAFFRETARRVLVDWYRARFADREFTHWGDKMPLARTPIALQTAFPEARFVILVRDPRDFVCSLDAFMKRPGARAIDPHMDTGIARSARDWAGVYRGYTAYLHESMLVRYEDLVRDPPATVREVLEFLELDADVDLEPPRDQRFFRGHGTSSDPTESIGRWRDELAAADVELVESTCGEVMQQLGYELSVDSRR